MELAAETDGLVSNDQLRRRLKRHPEELKKMGIRPPTSYDPGNFREHHVDHIWPVAFTGNTDPNRKDSIMNLCLMSKEDNLEFGKRFSFKKMGVVGVREFKSATEYMALASQPEAQQELFRSYMPQESQASLPRAVVATSRHYS
jgi:hypothetical protein